MADQEKPEYVKPECVDIGSVQPIEGGVCATGNGNVGGCAYGSMAQGGSGCALGYLVA